jgi:hypothetical protein
VFHEYNGQEHARLGLSGDKREARRKRQRLNTEIIRALETEAAEAERRRQLGSLRKELERFAASLPYGDLSLM